MVMQRVVCLGHQGQTGAWILWLCQHNALTVSTETGTYEVLVAKGWAGVSSQLSIFNVQCSFRFSFLAAHARRPYTQLRQSTSQQTAEQTAEQTASSQQLSDLQA